PDAFAAPGAAGVVRVAVAADHDLGVFATEPHVQHADLLNVFAGPDTAGAQNAEAHVVLDHDIPRPLIPGSQVKLMGRADRDIILHDVTLELVGGMSPAPVGK